MAPVPPLQVNAASPEPTAPITPKTDLLHKAWVFTEIPQDSLKYVYFIIALLSGVNMIG